MTSPTQSGTTESCKRGRKSKEPYREDEDQRITWKTIEPQKRSPSQRRKKPQSKWKKP